MTHNRLLAAKIKQLIVIGLAILIVTVLYACGGGGGDGGDSGTPSGFTAEMLDASPTYYVTYDRDGQTVQETIVVSGNGPYVVTVTEETFDASGVLQNQETTVADVVLNEDGTLTAMAPGDPGETILTITAETATYLVVKGVNDGGADTWEDDWFFTQPEGWLNSGISNAEKHHLISSRWAVLSDTGLGALSYGWTWMDLEGLSTNENQATAKNICSVDTAIVTEEINLGPVAVADGACVEEQTATTSVDEIETTVTGLGLDFSFTNLSNSDNSPDFAIGISVVGDYANTFYTNNQYYSFSFLAKKTQDSTIEDIVGDWGVVRLETEVIPNLEILYTTLSFPATISSIDGGSFSVNESADQIESEFIHTPDGSPVEKRRFERTNGAASFPISISPDGEVSIEIGDRGQPGRSAQTLDGFISPDGSFLVLSEGVPSVNALRDGNLEPQSVEEFTAHQLMLALKRDSTPDLAGHTYNIIGLTYLINNTGFGISHWGEGTTITFEDADSGSFNITTESGMVAFANNDTFGITTEASTEGPIPFGYSIESDGRIMLDFSAVGNIEQDLINGYSSVGGEIILFSVGVSYDGATSGDIGMWVGLCTNCKP